MTDQIIKRIKKLLELSASPVPAEAKLAFEKAQALMARYCLSEFDLNLNGETKSPEIVRREYTLKTKAPMGLTDFLPYIAQSIGQPFGVFVLVNSLTREIKLVGFPINTELVDYAIDCVLAQCIYAYRQEFAKHRSISFAPEFWRGVSDGLRVQFAPVFNPASDETAIAVYDPVKKYMEQFTGTSQWGSSTSNLASAHFAGTEAGKNATIRKAVNAGNTGKLLS